MTRPWLTLLVITRRIAWLAVPIFFVMSGYLIGGILYDTRNRAGFFRVFYCRRILRVFPIYYLTLLAFAFVDSLHGNYKLVKEFPNYFEIWEKQEDQGR